MASQFGSARHEAARKTILISLGGVILVAGVGVLVMYHSLRGDSEQLVASAPLLSKKDATMPYSAAVRKPQKPVTDSTADVIRAHKSAVAEGAANPQEAAPKS